MRRTTFAAVAAVMLGCLFASSAAMAQSPVVIDAVDTPTFEWAPANVTINTGETVRWEFDETAAGHTVTSTSTNWSVNESRGPDGAPVEFTFTEPGVYTFVCQPHAGTMTGSVTVEDEGGPGDELENVLVFSKTAGFRHTSIEPGIAAIEQLGADNDFNVDATEDGAQFTDANLAQYDAVVFLSTTGDVLDDAQEAAFQRYIQAGNGYVGIHAAADTEYEWAWYGEMLGGYFKSHPPGTPTASVDIVDADEPSTEGLPARWTRTDEWYNYQSPVDPVVNGGGDDYSPRDSGVHVLATVDESTYDEQDGNTTDDDHPIAWCSDFDGGHSWYTGMGHTDESFTEDAQFLQHILGGLQTVTGAAEADCGEPRQATPNEHDFEVVTLDDDTENPMKIDVADDGRVFYTERVSGEINVWNPATGQVTTALEMAVSSVQENGMLGIALDPDFATNGHLYATYTPLTPNDETRLSRFTVGASNTIDPLSEQVIFTWQAQRQQCCHSSGALEFGLDGSLYIATGDNTNPFGAPNNGFAPIDERPGQAFWDAQRTSANTNNLNGKILRIQPVPNATGVPGEGTTYTIPAGNLFTGDEGGGGLTRREIYAMGFRNPFTIRVDPTTGWLLVGDYGPDAGATVANRGPQGSVEYNVVDAPGNYGWPYCVRDNVPYIDFDYATLESGEPFDCANPVNESPNNTGLTELPPVQPATMWMGYSETDPRVPGLGPGGAPTSGPRYDYDPDLESLTKFPESFDDKWFIGHWNEPAWIKTATLDEEGEAVDVTNTPWMDTFNRPHDMRFGPDGALYVVDWDSNFGGEPETRPSDSGIYRIDYVRGARRPIAHGSATPDSGPLPLEVQFSSEGSVDPEGTSLTFEWVFGDGTTSTDSNPVHTFDEAGTYDVLLRVTDESGLVGTDTIQVVAGNTRPTVQITIPEHGQFAEFGETVPYEITVTDAEDGDIDCEDVTLDVQLGHAEHSHGLSQQQGCEGTFEAGVLGGHGGAEDLYTLILASYTDQGGVAGAGPLTGTDQAYLQPKLKQTEHFTATGRSPDSTATAGDPGVGTEATQDPEGGGTNIGFIENGDYVSYSPMNLKDIDSLSFRVASGGAGGGTIEVRTGSPTGELVATSPAIPNTGGWQAWTDIAVDLEDPPAGTHELFFVFRHPTDNTGGLFNVNWIEFKGKGAANTAAPELEASAEPTTGVAPLEVQFDAEATDPEGGALTYAWDFGVAGTSDDTSTEEDPTYTYEGAGTYNARVTVTDPDGGEASHTVQVRVTPSDQCPTGPVRSDEFEGDSLDASRWTVIRPDNTRPPTVSGGNLNFPIDVGSLYEGGASARNIIVQPLPEGAVEVTAKITTDPLTENYQQAGLRVYADDNNWASVHMIYANGSRDFEFIWESNGVARNTGEDKLGGIAADAPLTYWVRLVSDGTQLTAFYSFDGDQFLPVGRPGSLATFTNPQIGPAALSDNAASFPVARFDWIRFNPDSTGGGGGGGEGFRDDFDGTELADGWEVVRENQTLAVAGGALRIPAAQGDIYGTDLNNASNLVMRDIPGGDWEATAKINFEGNATYHQAGLLVYGDDDNFTKFGRLATDGTGAEKFEFIYENAGSPRNGPDDDSDALPADFSADYYLRITKTGDQITGAYSLDNDEWIPVGQPAPLPANAKIGMFAFNNAATTTPEAAFDWFTLTGDEVGGGGGGGSSFSDAFDGSSLDKTRWNGIVRENAASYAVADGALTITTEPGDIYTADDTDPPPNNFILQSADHAGDDWVIETKVDSRVDGGFGQGGLIAYGDDDNYVKLDPIADSAGINRIELRTEVDGTATGPATDPQIDPPGSETVFWLRLTKAGTNYTGEYSLDGITWSPAGTVANPMEGPSFGVYAFGPQAAGVGDAVAFDYFLLDGEEPGEPCECQATGDDFEGAGVDTTRWNNIIREDDSLYTVQDGTLNVTTANGDIYGESTTEADTGNFFLQTADHAGEDWEIETQVDAGELSDGYEQAGLLAYEDDGDYVKFDVLSDAGQTILNRIELRSEENNVVQAADPNNAAALPAGTEVVWLRLTKTGDMYKGEYSFDGTTWTEVTDDGVATQVQNDMAAPSFGLFTLGVNSGGGTAHFEYFSVDGQIGCEPEPENRAPVVENPTASPTIGFGPLEVDFAVTASDPDEGDELTYSWDFGDGSDPSTDEDPTHTYTEPGEYQAEVTVSDGEDETTRTVAVQVLEPDDAGARFRTLVYSKTAGFRHSSIDEGHTALELMGDQEDFQVDHTEDSTAFRADVLEHYDTVVFLSTTGDVLNVDQQTAFEDFIQAGGGFTGIHSASDTEYDWNWYGKLVGAYFRNHPANQTATVRVEDQEHPSTAGLPASYPRLDEWYNFKSPDFATVGDADYTPRPNVHVLANVDEATYDEADDNATDDDHPVTWCQRYDGGLSWYTAMGHTEASFTEANFLTQVLGGLETTAGVAPSADCGASDPDAPTVQGFADPQTGAAPLRVQFSATGLDPQGGRLTYRWEFGDGGSSLNASPRHTYTAAGTYTATVTATDPQGKTGTDTVEITVTPVGNQAPVVEAAGDPVSGNAPLRVRFSAQATDDRPAGQLTYLWDFDDGGSNAFGRNAQHTYMQPGTYNATVTVTDGQGAFDTAEVVITVANPPGNVAPSVQAAADPRSGPAPLRVRFTSAATDPDGDQVSSVWNFGDGVQAGGRNATHTYTTPGTYTATVTVTDPGGATDSAEVVITVTGTAGAAVTPPSAPGAAPQGDVAGESDAQPLVTAPKGKRLRQVIRGGLRLRVRCVDACRASTVLRLSGKRLGAAKAVRIGAGRTRSLVVKLDRTVRRNLEAAMRQAGVRRLTTTAVTQVVTSEGTRTMRAKVTLKL